VKKIVVACGSGIATSGMVATKLNNMLQDRGYGGKAYVDSADIKNIDTIISGYDIYVTLTPSVALQHDIPTFSGIPFLTGIGMEKVFEEILALL
jgi:PTS system galactitol-specific IIB component